MIYADQQLGVMNWVVLMHMKISYLTSHNYF